MLFSCSYDCWFDFRFGLWRIVAWVWVALQVFAVVCCVRVFELWMLVGFGFDYGLWRYVSVGFVLFVLIVYLVLVVGVGVCGWVLLVIVV